MMKRLRQDGELVVLSLRGKNRKEDYNRIVPTLEHQIEQHGPLRAMVFVDQVEGVQPSAVVKELSFDVTHRKDFRRCAIVGDRTWQKWAARLGNFLFEGEVEFFESGNQADAWAWLESAQIPAEGRAGAAGAGS